MLLYIHIHTYSSCLFTVYLSIHVQSVAVFKNWFLKNTQVTCNSTILILNRPTADILSLKLTCVQFVRIFECLFNMGTYRRCHIQATEVICIGPVAKPDLQQPSPVRLQIKRKVGFNLKMSNRKWSVIDSCVEGPVLQPQRMSGNAV